MQKNGLLARVTNLLIYSPFFLLIFLAIPAFTVLRLKSGLGASGDILLGNNIAFCLCLLVRVVCYLKNLRREQRYPASCCTPAEAVSLERSPAELKGEFARAGYRFDAEGQYGEKRNPGYLGVILLYTGMFLLLFFGSYDYLREYSIMLRMGVGEPIPLNGKGLTGEYEAGNLAATANLPKLRVVQQFLPDQKYPKGATEIALLNPDDNKEIAKGVIEPGKPFHHGGLDFHMTRFLFDAMITISTGKYLVYDGFIKFLPLAQKKGVYGYYGRFTDPDGTGKLKGEAWLRPDKKAVLVNAKLEGKQIVDTELQLWGVNKKTENDYFTSLQGLAQWSEIRVARSRHIFMLGLGAVLAVLGLLVGLIFRPQRVWLEPAEGGALVRATGAARKLLK